MTTITVEWYNRGYRKCTTFSPYGADSRKENMTHCRTIATTARITDRSRGVGERCVLQWSEGWELYARRLRGRPNCDNRRAQIRRLLSKPLITKRVDNNKDLDMNLLIGFKWTTTTILK